MHQRPKTDTSGSDANPGKNQTAMDCEVRTSRGYEAENVALDVRPLNLANISTPQA